MMSAAATGVASPLSALLQGLATLPPRLDLPVSDVVEDSRSVEPGALFLARGGTRTDGARFAGEARARGAVAMVHEGEGGPSIDAKGLLRIPIPDVARGIGVIADRFFRRPSLEMPVVAVTGTNGKSSVAHHVADAASAGLDLRAGIIGTLGWGLSGELDPDRLTTPDCTGVHRRLASLRDRGARLCAMEASSHALDQQRLAGVRVEVAVFTNLSRDHLDYHGDMKRYAEAKQRLFGELAPRAGVVNADDPRAPGFEQVLPEGAALLRFSVRDATDAQVQARVRGSGREGLDLEIAFRGERYRLRSPVLGLHGAQNLAAAFAVLLHLDVPPARAARALSQVNAVPGRLQARGGRGAPLVVVDYAHTPAALEAALGALRPLCPGRLWCLFGAGGDRDRGKRPLMGRVAAAGADRLIITDDNPRGEDGDAIVAQILEGIGPEVPREIERDRARAIALAVSSAGEDDVVLVAGKGHERGQVMAGEVRPFDDLTEVEVALEARVR